MNRRRFLIGLSTAAGACAVAAAAVDEPRSTPLSFPIVDTHVHFWDPKHLRYAWLDANPLLNRAYLPADYRSSAATHAIDRIVFVQAACARERALDEVKWVSALARDEPRIAAIVADAPIEEGDGAVSNLESLAAYPLVRGIRRMIQGESDPEFCLRPAFVHGIQLLPRFNLSFDLGMRRDQLPSVTKLVDACPDVRFIVDHCAFPDIRAGTTEPWKAELADLAKRPHVHCKLSGLATCADHQTWTQDDLRPYVDHVLSTFGFERTAFGSDWPVMLQATSPTRWIDTVISLTAGYSAGERRRLFAGTGAVFYRL